MIEVENLWKVYDAVEAVRDLSFAVQPGEVLGLVGPNGAGKTSTMRCLCGIIPPSAGEIRICGVSMYEAPVEAKRRVAFVPSEPRYFPYLTVWEHLQMFARLYECGDQSERAELLLESMSLMEKRDHLPESLSRGMQQKLMIGCALIHMPQVLIFDEPFTGLDPLAIRTIREILRNCADEGAAVLLSSHLLAMVEDMVDGVLIIQNGEKVAQGSLGALAATMPTLRKDADLEEIFLHATGRQAGAAAPAEATTPTEEALPLDDAALLGDAAVVAVDAAASDDAVVSDDTTASVDAIDAVVSVDAVSVNDTVAAAEDVVSSGLGASDGAMLSVDAVTSSEAGEPVGEVSEVSGAMPQPDSESEVLAQIAAVAAVAEVDVLEAGEPEKPEKPAEDAGTIPGQLPLSSSEILPQYTARDSSQASFDALEAAPGKWFADAEDEEEK